MARPEAGLPDIRQGHIDADVLTVHEDRQDGQPLLCPVLCGGKRLDGLVPLSASRDHATRQLASLPDRLRTLDHAGQPFTVEISSALQSLALAVDEQRR